MAGIGVALQLYAVRQLTADDMIGTLRAVRQIGYTAVETAGYGNSDPTSMRAVMDELGMRAISAHVPLERLENEFDTVMEEMTTLGVDYVIVPWLPPDRRGPETWSPLAAELNDLATRVNTHGFTFGYHNHDFEFQEVGGGTLWQVLEAETDPSLVKLQIDLYWVAAAGGDPGEMISRYRGRVDLLHAKELGAGEGAPEAVVGAGIMPWDSIIPTASEAGCKWLIVERDLPDDPIGDARAGHDNLVRLLAQYG